jgi:hypothetical protein
LPHNNYSLDLTQEKYFLDKKRGKFINLPLKAGNQSEISRKDFESTFNLFNPISEILQKQQ